ncbi:MAG: tRNA (cytidine(34)-2'-O)-methyltransferase [Succinivibrio sp.]|nr:tRNA (cytidine(34)-2'-O)-methyltransferase [Succinivibrio sp.]
MIKIVLYQTEMPGNAGNVIRLSVNCGAQLHFIGPLPFYLDNKRLLRAGLDYREIANFKLHVNFAKFLESEKPLRLIASSSKATQSLYDFKFEDNDYVIFGREKEGLSEEVYAVVPEDKRLKIPMVEGSRCLNLSNSVAVVAYEAWRQLGFFGAKA